MRLRWLPERPAPGDRHGHLPGSDIRRVGVVTCSGSCSWGSPWPRRVRPHETVGSMLLPAEAAPLERAYLVDRPTPACRNARLASRSPSRADAQRLRYVAV